MSDDQIVTAPVQTRRAMLLGAGAVGATVVLAACGTDNSTDGADDAAPGSDPGASDPTGGGADVLTKTGEVPVGGGLIFAAKDVVVTQPTAGQFKAFSAICTHQNCPVTSVDGGTINCTCHGSKFSITDGSVKTGPATRPLATKEVKVDGENITLA
ncbi:nitrite reductase/ring-hydroxylating ferredoxin subunit [Micromonospora pisi]|uniref:Cytochrome bc1 complex Rieske iron-sulfur subunit n=1 Tax=Micromonospora pisi TaxID=589240 RepID=A0A495JF70_9ACTN|nr:Rieske (2Fe-2S) protein [Micromonospora pisi]RKR87034.1 nitrite reductase/ring-hydroxylating ferredoxin subunit [Micromonospora pisi]